MIKQRILLWRSFISIFGMNLRIASRGIYIGLRIRNMISTRMSSLMITIFLWTLCIMLFGITFRRMNSSNGMIMYSVPIWKDLLIIIWGVGICFAIRLYRINQTFILFTYGFIWRCGFFFLLHASIWAYKLTVREWRYTRMVLYYRAP